MAKNKNKNKSSSTKKATVGEDLIDAEITNENLTEIDSDEQTVENPPSELEKKPKKKKKKKVYTHEEEQAILALPPHVTSWEVSPNTIDPEGGDLLTFYTNGVPTTFIEMTIENIEGLVDVLNDRAISVSDGIADGWSIRHPEDPSFPPILSLTSNNGVVATLPIDKKVSRHLVPAMLKIYDPHEKGAKAFKAWLKAHPKRGYGGLIILSASFVYSVISVLIR
jgi:hypothetical protein